VGAVLPAFQKRIVHRQSICRISKLARLHLAGFQKLWVQLRDMSSNRRKRFELAGFEKLSANSKAYDAKWLRTD
jgi:isocitrate dehydrogenase kinase/phosphatase